MLVKVLLIKKCVFCCLDQLFITQWQVLLEHEETSPAYFVETLLHPLCPYSYHPFLVKSNNNSNKFRTCCSFKGATKLQTKIIFVSATKIGESTTKIISCFSQKKLNLPLTSSIYLVALLPEMQRRLQQTKVGHALFC